MEAITVFTANQEESRIIKAILEALKFEARRRSAPDPVSRAPEAG